MGNSNDKYRYRTTAFDGDKCVHCTHPKDDHFYGGCHGMIGLTKGKKCTCQGDREYMRSMKPGYGD
jgi:hypothetical protein